jgi:curved DNA-binding protein CbpA
METHPDKDGGNAETFQQVSRAFEVSTEPLAL